MADPNMNTAVADGAQAPTAAQPQAPPLSQAPAVEDFSGWTPVQDSAPLTHPTTAPTAPAEQDFSAWTPVQGTAKSAAPPPADPGYVGHNFDPLKLEDWKKAYFGPTTAMGEPLTPAMQQETSGASDILHGNVRQGFGKIFAADSMHIVQGSPIEKLIQQINPDFKGGVDQAYVDANSRKGNIVNSAQFIDKTKNPATKAIAEALDGFTSPSNIAIMAETGGLGMVSTPQALAVSNRLLSAGFSAQAIATAYKNLKGVKDAYDKGDSTEATYLMTHAVVNGTLGYLAANHASEGALNKSVAGATGKAADAVGNAVNEGRQALAEKTVAPLVKKSASATLQDEKFNREPVQAILDEGLVGTKKTLVEKAGKRIGELSEGVDHVLQNHPNSKVVIDVEPVIDEAIETAKQSAKKIGDDNKVNVLESLKTALKTQYGPIKGTPFEMNNLKRDIGDVGAELGAFKSTDPIEASRAAVMGDVYKGIKDLVNEQVPDVAPLNDRISNLISAKTGLRRNIALGTNRPLIDSHMTVLGTAAKVLENSLTSAPIRTRVANIIKPGTTLEAPPVNATPQTP
jgi:hypothetical protein